MAGGTTKRITLVASELLGVFRNGGLGTATTFLALALARAGHEIEVLYLGSLPDDDVSPYWSALYKRHGVLVRSLPELTTRIEPADAVLGRRVVEALRLDPPDVVVVQDWQGPGAQAIRLRKLGLAFPDTRFLVYCHSTSAWLTETSRKIRRSSDAAAREVAERATIALADAAVSPSAFMLNWLRQHGWELPERALAIPLLTRSAALEEPPTAVEFERTATVGRIAFFGRLGELKGLDVFLDALALVDPALLDGKELLFLGTETKSWDAERIEAAVSSPVRHSVSEIRIETQLDQRDALALLGQPGTLAVMPSRAENSPYVVYECLELGIPFIAGRRGGAGELVASEDRERALVDSNAQAVGAALTRALSDGITPIRPARVTATAREAWLRLVSEETERVVARAPAPGTTGVVIVSRSSNDDLRACLTALATDQPGVQLDVVVVETRSGTMRENVEPQARLLVRPGLSIAAARAAGLAEVQGEWVIFLDAEDRPLAGYLQALLTAQAWSGADVVTCGVQVDRSDPATWVFDGQPAGLGVVANRFGTLGLLRRELAAEALAEEDHVDDDPDWTLYAALSLRGAAIVSVPEPLVEQPSPPGDARSAPGAATRVVAVYERALPLSLGSLGRLAAAAGASSDTPPDSVPGLIERAQVVLAREGLGGVARRIGRRLQQQRAR